MFSRSLLGVIMHHEESLGNSHECLECGRRFFAHSDGCAFCGKLARTKLLRESKHKEIGEKEIEE